MQSSGMSAIRGEDVAADSPVRYGFAGHETFPFRYPWLTKGVTGASERPDLFALDDAGVRLGVGKNMAKSIRHWCQALGLIEPVPGNRHGHVHVTALGEELAREDGWDPYLEDPGTLWLLHWLLVSNPERAATWHLAFTRWRGEPFRRDELVEWLQRISSGSGTRRSTSASLQRDVEVFTRTYAPARVARGQQPAEDTFDCPLVELGLLQEHGHERGQFSFVRGPKASLPTTILVYAIHDYWGRVARMQGTLSFDRLMYGVGSPGAAFKLSENALATELERLPAWSGLRFDDTAGVRVLLRTVVPDDFERLTLLRRHYLGGGR